MLGENIRKLRKKRRLSQEELGHLVGASQGSISLWERGEVEPSIPTIKEIANVLGVAFSDLVDDEDDFYPRPQSAPLLMLDGGEVKGWTEDELDEEMKRVFSSAPDNIKRASLDFIKFQLRNQNK